MKHPIKVSNNLRHDGCPMCNTRNIVKVGNISYIQPIHFSTNEIELGYIPEYWKCVECESYFVQNIIPESIAFDLYSQGESNGRWSNEPIISRKPENQIRCLANYFIPERKVLDVGSNTGELLDYAKSRGCITTGVEYSKSSRKVLKSKGHMAFAALSIVEQKFDVITAFDLVEHLYNVSGFIQKCKNILVEGGVLIILTGNPASISAKLSKSGWWYIKYPEHIVFPSKKFYSSCPGFKIQKWIWTYASVGYRHPVWYSIRCARSGLLNGTFSGLPSIGPDHVLAVMKSVNLSKL